jgi:hypothetical protein
VVEGEGMKNGTTASLQLAWVGASGRPVTSDIAASTGRRVLAVADQGYLSGRTAVARRGEIGEWSGRWTAPQWTMQSLNPHRHPSHRRQRQDARRFRQRMTSP